jgi:hypothetical protein
MHLFQLAGGQAWPNLLPVLALQPATVTFLTSADPHQSYAKSVDNLMTACQAAGVRATWKTISTQSQYPTTEECRKVIKDLQPDCINLTGGMKPMSIAAYDLARSLDIPAFYLDTRRKTHPVESLTAVPSIFTDPKTWDMAAITARITVPIALKANGFPVPADLKSPPEHWTSFSIQAAQIRMDHAADLEIAKAIGELRHKLLGSSSAFPKKAQLRSLLQTPFSAPVGSSWHTYLTAASQAGVIEALDGSASGDQDFLLVREDPVTTQADALRSLAAANFKLLEGIWFELALRHHLQQKASFSDIRWSVEGDHLQDPTASSLGETDLVAFNTKQLTLHFISCKTSGPHGSALDHIQGLRGRATKEGGQFSKAELWIFRPKTAGQRQELENHCKAQNVILRVFTETPCSEAGPM